MENIGSFYDIIRIGGFVMYPLLLFSVAGLAVVLERGYVILRNFMLIKRTDTQLQDLLLEKNLSGAVTFCSAGASRVSKLFLSLLYNYTPCNDKSKKSRIGWGFAVTQGPPTRINGRCGHALERGSETLFANIFT